MHQSAELNLTNKMPSLVFTSALCAARTVTAEQPVLPDLLKNVL